MENHQFDSDIVLYKQSIDKVKIYLKCHNKHNLAYISFSNVLEIRITEIVLLGFSVG